MGIRPCVDPPYRSCHGETADQRINGLIFDLGNCRPEIHRNVVSPSF